MPNKKKKKQCRNGLYWFMQDLLPELRREGRVFPNGMADVVPIALPRWKALPDDEKERYEIKAKQEKKKHTQAKEADKYRLDNVGNVVADRVDKNEEKERQRIKEGKISRSRWPLAHDEFIDFKFYVIAFEYFWETDEEQVSLPVEVGLTEFSLHHGVTKTFQRFIKPRTEDGRDIPLGYRFKCKQYSEERHGIPITDFEFAEKSYLSLLLHIENFVNPNGEKHEYPPVYAMNDELHKVDYALQWLHSQAGPGCPPKITKIFELENMVLDLFFRKDREISRSGISELFTNSNFDYEPNVRCSWHEEQDTRFCALGTARKVCYHLLDALADSYNYELTPQHLPQRTDDYVPIVISRPLSNNVDAKPRQPARDDRRLPQGSAYSSFASRDVRYNYDEESDDEYENQVYSQPTLRKPNLTPTTVWANAAQQEDDVHFEIPQQRPTLSQAVVGRSDKNSPPRPSLHDAVQQNYMREKTLHFADANGQKPTLHNAVQAGPTSRGFENTGDDRPTLHSAVFQQQASVNTLPNNPRGNVGPSSGSSQSALDTRSHGNNGFITQQQRSDNVYYSDDEEWPSALGASSSNNMTSISSTPAWGAIPTSKSKSFRNPETQPSSIGRGSSQGRGAQGRGAQGRGAQGRGRGDVAPGGRGMGRGIGRGMVIPKPVNAPGATGITVNIPGAKQVNVSLSVGASGSAVPTAKVSAWGAPPQSQNSNTPIMEVAPNSGNTMSNREKESSSVQSGSPHLSVHSQHSESDDSLSCPGTTNSGMRLPSTLPKALVMAGRGRGLARSSGSVGNVPTAAPPVDHNSSGAISQTQSSGLAHNIRHGSSSVGQMGGVGGSEVIIGRGSVGRGVSPPGVGLGTVGRGAPVSSGGMMLGRGRGVYMPPTSAQLSTRLAPPPGFGRGGIMIQLDNMSIED